MFSGKSDYTRPQMSLRSPYGYNGHHGPLTPATPISLYSVKDKSASATKPLGDFVDYKPLGSVRRGVLGSPIEYTDHEIQIASQEAPNNSSTASERLVSSQPPQDTSNQDSEDTSSRPKVAGILMGGSSPCDLNHSVRTLDPYERQSDHNSFSSAHEDNMQDLFSSSPYQRVYQNMKKNRGCDAYFTSAMDFVMSKMTLAISDRDSPYLFRDFAGHFTNLLDQFGPGGCYSGRAPVGVSWVFQLIVPWMDICEDATDSQLSVFEEVSCWVGNLCTYLGLRNDQTIFDEGVWSICVKNLASTNPHISATAYKTAKTVTNSWPINSDLVKRVVGLNRAEVSYDQPEMSYFRCHHLKLMISLLTRIQDVQPEKVNTELANFVYIINHAMEKLQCCETNPAIMANLPESMDFATSVYRRIEYFLQHGSAAPQPNNRGPRINSMALNHYDVSMCLSTKRRASTAKSHRSTHSASTCQTFDASPSICPTYKKERKWKRFIRKLRCAFKHDDAETAEFGETESYPSPY